MLAWMARGWQRWGGLALTLGVVGAIALAERARPLRRQRHDPVPRLARNLALGAMSQAVVALVEAPATRAVARRNTRHRRGLLHWAGGGVVGRVLAFVAMDYTIYWWHIATHKVPWLWRLHRVHHLDPDMDMTTAARFHFADMLVSLPWRLVQVRLAGLDEPLLRRWQAFFMLSVLFHHSNTRLPPGWEPALSRLITTPAMHGLHHDQRLAWMDSNWSSGLALWDHLHSTFRADPPPGGGRIGVADSDAPGDVPLVPALLAPLAHSGGR